MRILVVGSGGREQAIIKKITESPSRPTIHCIGIVRNPKIISLVTPANFFTAKITNSNILEACRQCQPNMVVIGPEAPLANDIATQCHQEGFFCFGPNKNHATIESSKIFARKLMWHSDDLREFLPTVHYMGATYQTHDNYYINRRETVSEFCQSMMNRNSHVVIKKDGLCSGKGVYVQGVHFNTVNDGLCLAGLNTTNLDELDCNEDIVMEERLIGEEFSCFTITDGKTCAHSPPVKDYKCRYDGNTGSNTGGMGTITDIPTITPTNEPTIFGFLTARDIEVAQRINEIVLNYPSMRGYVGVLYGSFIKTSTGIKVIEFNCRFGDGEVINLMALLKTDLVDILSAIKNQKLSDLNVEWDVKSTVCKYLVRRDYAVNTEYPVDESNGEAEFQLNSGLGNYLISSDDIYVASINQDDKGNCEMCRSRVLAILGIGSDLSEATNNCNIKLIKIRKLLPNPSILEWRDDIGEN